MNSSIIFSHVPTPVCEVDDILLLLTCLDANHLWCRIPIYWHFCWQAWFHTWRMRSPIYHRFHTSGHQLLPSNAHIIGDSAYLCDTFLLCPYRDNGHLTSKQKHFNAVLSSTRHHWAGIWMINSPQYVADGPDNTPPLHLYEGDTNVLLTMLEQMNFQVSGIWVTAVHHYVRCMHATVKAENSWRQRSAVNTTGARDNHDYAATVNRRCARQFHRNWNWEQRDGSVHHDDKFRLGYNRVDSLCT